MIPDDFSRAAASASVALRCNECCAWLPQRCLFSEARRLLGSRVRSDDVGLWSNWAESQRNRNTEESKLKSEENRTRLARGSKLRVSYAPWKNHMQGCLCPSTSSRIWRRDLGRQAHDHAHHITYAALSRFRRPFHASGG